MHRVIRNNLGQDPAFRQFAEKSFRAFPESLSMQAYRDYNLQRTIHYAYERSSFYRERFQSNGLTPKDIPGFEGLERFPLTEPSHLSLNPEHFLCTSQSEIARPCVFVTSGTTGPQKRIYWSDWDIDRITDFMSAGISTVANAGDTVQILLPDCGPDSQADLLRQGVEKLGVRPIVSGIEQSASEQMSILEKFHSTVIFGYASHIYRMTKELQKHHNLQLKGVRVLFLAGEYIPEARRRELEAAWGCSVRTHYGLTEMGLGVAVECDSADGYHFNEADLMVEIIDPDTEDRVPPGEEGELIFTTLTRQAMPLIRYRTHDYSRLLKGPCSCGVKILQKIDFIRKRLDTIIKLSNGEEIYPVLFDELLYGFPEIVDYRVKLQNGKIGEQLSFQIEISDGNETVLSGIRNTLFNAPVIADNMASETLEAPELEFVAKGHLESTNRAKKVILDCR
ncbi:MAG: AMP-binding protein [Acidobacteriota bacterium]